MGFVFTGPKSSRQDIKPVVTPQIIKAEEPKKKSKFWGITKYIMSGASNVLTSVPDAYKGVKNYISNTQKDLAPPVIDPALHWNLYNQGKTNELTNLESSGVVVPKLVSPPPGVSPLTPQEQDYYSNKVLNDMTKDRVIKEDREASILETGGWQAKDDEYYKTISQDRLEETKELVRDRKAKNLSKDILNAYQLGGYPVDKKLVENLENRMLEIVDTNSLTYQDMSDVYHFPKLTKRTDVSGPNYPEVFAQRAKEAFTSGILESNVEPETTGEEIAATLGDLAGMVTSLWLTGGTLKGAALLTKTGQTFQKTAPYLFELSKSVGAFNIHGQLRPELMGDWAARMDTATMDTSMALFFGGSSAMFPGMAGIPVTAGVFGGLSYLNGDPIEIVITNALAGGMLHGMGFMKPRVGRQILNNNAKKTLERYSDTKLKNGYTNAEINAVESLSKKRLLKDGYIDEVDAVTRSAQHLRAIAPEKRAFTSPGSPYNNLKKTIREVGEEFKALTKTKEKINLEPAVMGDIMRATQPGKPKVVDSVRVVIGDMKTQPLQKETLKFLRSVEGKESYLKRVEELKKDFSKATGKARKIIGGHIDALVAVGKQLGYEGYRITDIKRKFTETDIQLREGEIGIAIEGLAKRSVDSLELSGNAKVNEMSVIRKGISDIANDLNINERVVATEFLRRFMEMDTGRTAYKEYIKNSDIDNILNIKPVDDVVVSLKVKAVPAEEVPKKLKKIKGFAQEPIEKTVEVIRKGIGTLKDATERSKLIEDAIRKEYPKASDKQIKLLKKVVGKLLTGKKDFATAIKEVGELTQKEIVKAVVSEKPKSIKEVAKETKILEPNVRRIFGVGEKEGTFERVEKGVYILSKDGKDMAYIHPGDALEILPKLAKKKIKADMIFLDIPYKTPAVVGGNRGVKYGLIEPSQFKTVVDSLLKMTRTKDTPILYMYSNAVSGKKEMSKFNDILLDNFKPIARGSYAKLTKAGKPFGFPTPSGWKPLAPEGIILASVSGKLDPAIKSVKDANLKFAFNRPKGWQSEKPKEMLEEMIKMTTKEGDMVFDPFAGSGVTGEQAIKAGRKTRLIEKSEEAVKKHIKPRIKKALEESPKQKVRELAKEEVKEVKQVLRKAKGLSADDIVKKNPDINLKRDVPIRDIHGNKRIIPEGEALTPYELKGNKVLLQDGETYIVSKNQYENIKGQSIKGEAKEFAPELKETKETVKGEDIPEEEIQRLLNDEVGQGMTRKGAIEYLKKEEGYIDITGTKFDEYQLPGGKNYKEILIQAPTDAQKRLESIGYEFRDLGDGRIEIIKNDGRIGTANSLTEAVNKRISLEPSLKNIFKSPHFTEPNILAWARTNVRKYKNKAVLFIEEIQSDWASAGRKEGFTDSKAQKAFDDYSALLKKKYDTTNPILKATKLEAKKWNDLLAKGQGVPSSPLLKKWQELAIKRALKEAVDTKAEYLSWITGEQTSARYNLATMVERITWEKGVDFYKEVIIKPKVGGEFYINIDKKGVMKNGVGMPSDWRGKKLDESLGKGLADKIMEKNFGDLAGEGLKFGGEWAINLYDKQIPNIVKNITGVRPEVIDMKLPIQKISQWDDMRGGILHTSDLKVGKEITNDLRRTSWIITDVLGDGKFNAIPKKAFDKIEKLKKEKLTQDQKRIVKETEAMGIEKFYILGKKSKGQQAIKITPAIQALVKGEAPPMKKPSGVSPLAEKPEVKVQPSAPKPKTKPPTKEELGKVDQFAEMPNKDKLYTGIDPGIGVFWTETLSPLAKATPKNFKEAGEGIVNMFAPAARSKATRLTASVIRKKLGQFAHKKDMGAKISEERMKWWDKNKEVLKDEFLDSMEGGKLNKRIRDITNKTERKVLQSLMDNYRERLDKTHEISKEVNEKIGYIMNYVPHIWKDVSGAKKIFGEWQMVIGKEKFSNKRLIDFIKKGKEMGLKLVTNNPEELILMREISAWQAKSQLDVINELSSMGLLKSPKEGSKLAGYQQLRTTYGTYSMPGDVARVIHNWLEPRLWADPSLKGRIFKKAMKLKNMTVAGKLALSGFHIIETGVSSLAAQSMLAARRLGKGDVKGFFKEGLKSFTTIPSDVGIPFIKKGKGGEIIEAWFNEPKYEWQKEAIDLIERAGGRPLMSENWRVNSIKGFKQAARKGNYITALGRSFPALLETMAIPMFDYWVPRMKVASFYKLAKDYTMRHPELTGKELDMELNKIWDSTDNRFGQMIYSNLFWAPKLRDFGTLLTLSMGWQLGTIREFGGAATIDLPKTIKQLALKMKDPKVKVEMTDRMLYTAMYTMWFGMFGATLTYAMTGNWPTELVDYFYPKTGEKNSDGTDARLQMPTMLKEVFRAEKILTKYGLGKGTVRMIKNKQAPVVNSLVNLWQNKDFYGTEIHNPNDPFVKQAKDIASFFITENFEPISVSEWMEMKKKDETNPLVFAGFTGAPSYITQTKISAKISALYERRIGGPTISAEERHKREAKTEIRNKFRKNKLTIKDVEKALADGTLTESGLNEFFRRAALPSDVRLFSALGAEDQHALLLKMKQTFSELGRYLPEAKKAVKEKWGLNTD